MQNSRQRDALRLFLALNAVLAASAICNVQHHFRLLLLDPATYPLPFQHRCGQVFLLTSAWAVFEAARLLHRLPQTAPASALMHSPSRR